MRSICVIVVMIAIGSAQAQPTADQQHRAQHDFWINNSKYTSPRDGSHCCGEDDCKMIPRDQVRATPAGYRLPSGEVVPYAEAQPSEDGEFWRCEYYDGSRRCFFSPFPGA
jgi:hypothetical protein